MGDVPWSRITRFGGKYAIEFTGVISKETFEKEYPELIVSDYFVVPLGRIFGGEENYPPTENIIFSGRFSRWEYGLTSEHIIAQAINYKNNEKETIRTES